MLIVCIYLQSKIQEQVCHLGNSVIFHCNIKQIERKYICNFREVYVVREINFQLHLNWIECDSDVSFPFDIEPNGIPFGLKSKGKLSPQWYSIQFEREWKSISPSVKLAETSKSLRHLSRKFQYQINCRTQKLYLS